MLYKILYYKSDILYYNINVVVTSVRFLSPADVTFDSFQFQDAVEFVQTQGVPRRRAVSVQRMWQSLSDEFDLTCPQHHALGLETARVPAL